jgi:hypothetical protein
MQSVTRRPESRTAYFCVRFTRIFIKEAREENQRASFAIESRANRQSSN